MAKGMRVKLNYHVSHDPDTGAEVTRLTPGGHLSSQLLLSEVLLTMAAIYCSPASLTATGTTIC
nr:oligogalacturonate lyase family protein [Klebsiella pneumoniae subsp. pneumoniae]MDQ6121116.1 oligogalacturonate lyase family protein [Klebsiella pneumoniae subsp. pneumoniae]